MQVGGDFFDTLHITGVHADEIPAKARAAGYNLRAIDSDSVGISLDETATRADVVALAAVFGAQADVDALDASTADALPAGLLRGAARLELARGAERLSGAVLSPSQLLDLAPVLAAALGVRVAS